MSNGTYAKVFEKYAQNMEEKKNRSDRCDQGCQYKDVSTNKCLYETCLFEELPPTQQSSISDNCWVCGAKISINGKAFDNNRLCPTCQAKLIELIQKKDAIITHIESHASHG